jgi:hypothetical protein
MNSCDAARAGAFVASISRFPVAKFRLDFIGTGSAELASDRLSDLARLDAEASSVPMRWTRNRFVGEHWLFGRVTIDLDDRNESTGTISDFSEESGRLVANNTNRFFFKFTSSRFPRMALRTLEPIINSARIDSIPPVGSTFTLGDSNSLKVGRVTSFEGSDAFGTLQFDFCEVTTFPPGNICIRVEKVDYADLVATVTARIENLTSESVRATYFVVDHSDELSPSGDAVFVNLGPNESRLVKFTITSTISGHSETLPLFAGISKPEALRGSAQVDLLVQF